MVLVCPDHVKVYLPDCIDKQCYLCLEQIEYYYKFDCNCHNFFHIKCIENNIIQKCLICNKNIFIPHDIFIQGDSYIFDLSQSIFFIDKIIKIIEMFFIIFNLHLNILTFSIFLIVNIVLTLTIIIPIVLLNIFYNFTKKNIFKILDLGFSLLILTCSIIFYYKLFSDNILISIYVFFTTLLFLFIILICIR